MYDPAGRAIYFSTVIYDPKNNGSVFSSGMDVDSQGNIYVGGYTPQLGLPTTAGAFRTAINGNYDGFIAKISAPAVPPTPTITLVANAEGDVPTIAPNTWVEIKGSNLAQSGDSRTWQSSDFVNNQMPVQLDGVSVTVNGQPAYVYYISPTQVNILTPPAALSGSVPVQVTNNGPVSATFMVQAQAEAPSFFVFNAGPYIAATHADGSYIGPTSPLPRRDHSRPTRRDDRDLRQWLRANLLACNEWIRIAIGNAIAAAGHHHRRRACDGGVRRPCCARRVSVQRGAAVLARQWRPAGDRNVQRLENPAGNTDRRATVAVHGEFLNWRRIRHLCRISKCAIWSFFSFIWSSPSLGSHEREVSGQSLLSRS